MFEVERGILRNMATIQVVSALIVSPDGQRVLMALRPMGKTRGGQWELPGGKVEGTESHEEALKREIFEELGVFIRVLPERLAVASLSVEVDFDVHLYRCEIVEGRPRPIEATALEWLDLEEAVTYRPMVPSSYLFFPQIRHLFRSKRTHDLKTWPEFFDPVFSGLKSFELRKDDRGYVEGDYLLLREWDPEIKQYTGRSCLRKILYMTRASGTGLLVEDAVCMSLGRLPGVP